MKKVYLFISLMLSALAVGCNDSNTPDDAPIKPGVSDKVVVTVNATLYGDSKWAAGDKVAINGLESAAVTEEGAGGSTYAFVSPELEAPVIVHLILIWWRGALILARVPNNHTFCAQFFCALSCQKI